jgi:hypothetical protein
MEDGTVVPDPNWVTLKGGFRTGMTYQVIYQSKNPPVAGLGFAAIRDLASTLKYDPERNCARPVRVHLRSLADGALSTPDDL